MASMSDKGAQLIGEISSTVKKAIDPVMQGLTLQSATLELIIARLDAMDSLHGQSDALPKAAAQPKAAAVSDEASSASVKEVATKAQAVNIFFSSSVKNGLHGFRETYVTDAILADLKLKRPAELSANPSEEEKKANVKAWGTVATKVWAKIADLDRACIKKVQAALKNSAGSEAPANLVEDTDEN